MIINDEAALDGMKRASEAVAVTLKKMREYTTPGMSTKELDEFGGRILMGFGARSAPYLTYQFPGYTCISLNEEVAHGVPSDKRIIREGDLLNIDVSAELAGYWSDNGGSFVVGTDVHGYQPLISASIQILKEAISRIRGGIRLNSIGAFIEKEARRNGYNVIRNLGGHGVGLSLHEQPQSILNYKDRFDRRRFRKGSVVALETFITTGPTQAIEQQDGFTLLTNRKGYVAQHEHTILITDAQPIILTAANALW